MIQVIETNLLINFEDDILDHQSRIVEVEDWDTYCKAYREYNGKAISFKSKTMPGDSVKSDCLLSKLRYDDFHLSCDIFEFISDIEMYTTKKLAYIIG